MTCRKWPETISNVTKAHVLRASCLRKSRAELNWDSQTSSALNHPLRDYTCSNSDITIEFCCALLRPNASHWRSDVGPYDCIQLYLTNYTCVSKSLTTTTPPIERRTFDAAMAACDCRGKECTCCTCPLTAQVLIYKQSFHVSAIIWRLFNYGDLINNRMSKRKKYNIKRLSASS